VDDHHSDVNRPADRRQANVQRVRSLFSALTGLVAVLALVVSLIAVWANDVLFDSEAVSSAVETALDQPEVTDALAAYLTDQVLIAVGADEVLVDVLPPALEPLAPAITGGVRAYVIGRLAVILANEDVRAVIVAGVERSHAALMRVLQGDGLIDGITIADGEVTVNLLPLIARGLVAVQDLGLLRSVEVPQLTAAGDPDAQRIELAAALGRDLPPTFGEMVVYRGEVVAEAEATVQLAQRMIVLAKRAMLAAMVLTVVAAGASLWLARRRARAGLLLLLAAVAATLVVRALGVAAIERVPRLAVQPGARAATRSVVGSLASGLIALTSVVALLGVLAALAVWATGDSPAAMRLRGGTRPAGSSLARSLGEHREVIGAIAYVAAMAVVLIGGFGLLQLLIAAGLIGTGWVLARAAAPAT
jgi:hypothetical protein